MRIVPPLHSDTLSSSSIYRNSTQQHTAPHLLQSPFVGAYALDEGDGEGVELVGLVSLVDDGQRYAEAKVLQVAHLR